MRFKIFYGGTPNYKKEDLKDFSHGNYECHALFRNRKGDPVGVFRSRKDDVWKVQDGFSEVFFGTYAEALAYCRGRFTDQDGKKV